MSVKRAYNSVRWEFLGTAGTGVFRGILNPRTAGEAHTCTPHPTSKFSTTRCSEILFYLFYVKIFDSMSHLSGRV